MPLPIADGQSVELEASRPGLRQDIGRRVEPSAQEYNRSRASPMIDLLPEAIICLDLLLLVPRAVNRSCRVFRSSAILNDSCQTNNPRFGRDIVRFPS